MKCAVLKSKVFDENILTNFCSSFEFCGQTLFISRVKSCLRSKYLLVTVKQKMFFVFNGSQSALFAQTFVSWHLLVTVKLYFDWKASCS